MTNKEMLDRVNQLTGLINSSNAALKLLQETLENATKEQKELLKKIKESECEPKFERAEYNGCYYRVFTYSDRVSISERRDLYIPIDNGYYYGNNYFHTIERAQEVANKINFLLKLERLYDIYCPNCENGKYYISQNTESGRYCYGYIRNVPNKYPTSTMFPSEEIAQKVCNILNAELEETE